MQKKLDKILKLMKELEPIIRIHYKAQIIGVFGSYARGEQKKGSDLDVLVKFESTATLFNLVGLEDFLEQRLKIKVDAVPVDTVREEIKENVLHEAVYL